MKKVLFPILFLLACFLGAAQTVEQKLKTAFAQFQKDSQLRFAVSSLYVIDAQTGRVVFDHNSRVGLAPASTQKVIIAATAFDMLGASFQYKTQFVLHPVSTNQFELLVLGTGDPTLGSWRYATTVDSLLLKRWVRVIKNQVKDGEILGIRLYDREYGDNLSIPGGYTWEDMGNYYGAGWSQLNWRENQYDLTLRSGKTGTRVKMGGTYPEQDQVQFFSHARAGKAGTGDNAYIYCPPYSAQATVQGTIPPERDSFVISGAMPDPAHTLGVSLFREMANQGMNVAFRIETQRGSDLSKADNTGLLALKDAEQLSPRLDSMVYWYLRKSVNLYGEAFLNTLFVEKDDPLFPKPGTEILKDYWKEKGIDPDELNIADGSGLSPANRVTTHAQVEILKYARKRNWFPAYYASFPEYNQMKMKSGTIGDVKGFTGYHKAGNGKEYIFAFLVNNYSGSSSSLVKKMYKVLDLLK